MLVYLAIGLLLAAALHIVLTYRNREPGMKKGWKIVGGAAVLMAVIGRLGATRSLAALNSLALLAPFLAPLIAKYLEEEKQGANTQMTAEEARQILGVSATATEEEIQKAHRTLITRNHPDTGGTQYLASKINQARDLLLKK